MRFLGVKRSNLNDLQYLKRLSKELSVHALRDLKDVPIGSAFLLSFWLLMSFQPLGLNTVSESNGRFGVEAFSGISDFLTSREF